MTLQNILCAIGFHDKAYRMEYNPFVEHGEQKKKASFVRYCPHCPNGREIIVKLSLVLGD